MKNNVLKIGIIALLIVMLCILTGCGDDEKSSKSKKSSIDKELNKLMDEIEEKESDFHVATIQKYLEENSNYRLLDGDKEEFDEKPDSPKDKYTSVQKSEQLINTSSNYVLIYNTKTEKYYSIPMGAVGYKPYFNKPTEVK